MTRNEVILFALGCHNMLIHFTSSAPDPCPRPFFRDLDPRDFCVLPVCAPSRFDPPTLTIVDQVSSS